MGNREPLSLVEGIILFVAVIGADPVIGLAKRAARSASARNNITGFVDDSRFIRDLSACRADSREPEPEYRSSRLKEKERERERRTETKSRDAEKRRARAGGGKKSYLAVDQFGAKMRAKERNRDRVMESREDRR